MTHYEILNYALMGVSLSMEKEEKLLKLNPNDKIAQVRYDKLYNKFKEISALMRIEENKVG